MTFKPEFKWHSAIIDVQALPVVISFTIPSPSKTVIAITLSETTKQEIIQQLETQSMIKEIATKLAIQAGEGKRKVEIPKEYKHFKHLFSDEASQ